MGDLTASEIFEKFERYASDIRKARFEIYGPEKAMGGHYGWGPSDENFNEEYYYGYDEESYYPEEGEYDENGNYIDESSYYSHKYSGDHININNFNQQG